MKTYISKSVVAALALGFLQACTDTGGTGASAADPYEATNRKVHNFNKAADRTVIGPVSEVYGKAVPGEVRASVSNGVSNLELPGDFINHVLQGDIQDAGETFFRFALNSTLGLGGLRDPAGDAGLYHRETNFGETLAIWGVREGAYLELPLAGPSSERDVVGKIVDFGIDPVQYIVPSDVNNYLLGATVLDVANNRYEYRALVNTLLYESADSYSALRLSYLQNLARKTNGGITEDDLEDPYADQ